jgi:hypothetical protein
MKKKFIFNKNFILLIIQLFIFSHLMGLSDYDRSNLKLIDAIPYLSNSQFLLTKAEIERIKNSDKEFVFITDALRNCFISVELLRDYFKIPAKLSFFSKLFSCSSNIAEYKVTELAVNYYLALLQHYEKSIPVDLRDALISYLSKYSEALRTNDAVLIYLLKIMHYIVSLGLHLAI